MTAGTVDAPAWVIEALGPDASDLRRVPWGFTNETWAGTAADGVRYAATRMASPATAARVARHGPEIARRMTAVGLEASAPIASRSLPERGVVISTWIDGTPGMTRLGSPGGPEAVGAALGLAWRALGRVEPSGLGVDDAWARPAELATAAQRWLTAAGSTLRASDARKFATRIERLPELLEKRPPRFVHGDLVPANVLIRDGSPPALLDFEAARIADSMFDPAWFAWIVGYHHPDVREHAWTAFAEAAGIGAASAAEVDLLALLPAVRILEIVADVDLPPASRARWLDQLGLSVEQT